MSYTGKCVTLIGTASIQDYVFRSNELKENVGASQIVHHAIERWSEPRPGCEIIYCGGGNAALVFDDCPSAKAAVRQWSLNLLQDAPGLRVVVAHSEVGQSLRQAYDSAARTLAANESLPPFGYEPGALPFVKVSPTTGLGASTMRYGEVLSAESAAKQAQRESFAERLERDVVEHALANAGYRYEIPKEFSSLGTRAGESQIALVHVDGNGIGQLFRDCLIEPGDDAAFVTRVRELSRKVTGVQLDALRLMVGELASDSIFDQVRAQNLVEHSEDRDSNRYYLPVRPMVFGGDDLTFVCHGRLGLSLAARYILHFEQGARRDLKQELTACAGVLIMPQKFPFSRAYRMVEELCDSAKERARAKGGSWMDFQVLLEGAGGSMGSLRKNLYGELYESGLERHSILKRPYAISERDHSGWLTFESAFHHFTDAQKGWPRSRAKGMLEAIAAGGGRAKQLQDAYAARGYVLPDGLEPDDCFDVLEMLDFHCRIDWGETLTQTGAGR